MMKKAIIIPTINNYSDFGLNNKKWNNYERIEVI